jgi:cell division protein ZapE
MNPSNKYSNIIKEYGYITDDAQQHVLTLLDKLQSALVHRSVTWPERWWQKIAFRRKSSSPMRGIYLWGGVGRGKTFLMDIFFQCLPIESKRRVHFHQFMNEVHLSLGQMGNTQNPLRQVAKELSEKTSVLCLDEFVIVDIADAMIISGLLEAMFEQAVVLVTTSNNLPQNLYHDGLQRARFLPAIELIKKHCQVINLDGGHDYRLRGLLQTHMYMVPHSPTVQVEINSYLSEHVSPYQTQATTISINDRVLHFQHCAEDTIWFNFAQLCKTTRSQSDYLELARLFNTLILTDIEVMSSQSDDVARRFVLLIDVLYDHHVVLICSAAARPEELYLGKRLAFEFERTASRLLEMQSQQYLAQAHTSQ